MAMLLMSAGFLKKAFIINNTKIIVYITILIFASFSFILSTSYAGLFLEKLLPFALELIINVFESGTLRHIRQTIH